MTVKEILAKAREYEVSDGVHFNPIYNVYYRGKFIVTIDRKGCGELRRLEENASASDVGNWTFIDIKKV